MNAVEFEMMVWRLRAVTTNIERMFKMAECGGSVYVKELTSIWGELDAHRMEMSKVEHAPVTCGQLRDAELGTPAHGSTAECDTVSQSQLSALEKRLNEIETKADSHRKGYISHLRSFHSDLTSDEPQEPCFPPASG